MLRLSKTSKLDGIRSWSLEAINTCPASIGSDGQLVDACKGCYATQGNYRYPNVKAPRVENKSDWQRANWVADMVRELDSDRYFRWFDSGDVYSLKLAEKILAVMEKTPWVKHWLPTRMHKFEKFAGVFSKMRELPNVAVRFSSDSVTGEYVEGLHGSTILPNATAPNGVTVCKAYDHGGKCNGCRACYDPKVSVIGYVAHGRSMAKVVRLALAN